MVEPDHSRPILALEVEQEIAARSSAEEFVSGLSPSLRKDLTPYARILHILNGPESDSLSFGRKKALGKLKTQLERSLARKYTDPSDPNGLENFLYNQRLNVPEVRVALTTW